MQIKAMALYERYGRNNHSQRSQYNHFSAQMSVYNKQEITCWPECWDEVACSPEGSEQRCLQDTELSTFTWFVLWTFFICYTGEKNVHVAFFFFSITLSVKPNSFAPNQSPGNVHCYYFAPFHKSHNAPLNLLWPDWDRPIAVLKWPTPNNRSNWRYVKTLLSVNHWLPTLWEPLFAFFSWVDAQQTNAWSIWELYTSLWYAP